MTSQVPFKPLTPEALARLTPDEQAAFTRALLCVAEDKPPSLAVAADLVLIVQRLIAQDAAAETELAAVRRGAQSEREAVRADLGQLLELLGLGDYARPQSPHEVFQECLSGVRDLRADRARADEAAVAERLRIAAILSACLPDGADPLTPAILKALVAFWEAWHHAPLSCVADGRLYLHETDLAAVSEAADAVEELLFAPVDDDEDDRRLALAALDFEECDSADVLKHAIAALAHDNEGVRLWMLDCGNLVQKHRERAEAAEAKLAEVRSVLLEGGQDASTARRRALAIISTGETPGTISEEKNHD